MKDAVKEKVMRARLAGLRHEIKSLYEEDPPENVLRELEKRRGPAIRSLEGALTRMQPKTKSDPPPALPGVDTGPQRDRNR